MIQTASSLHVAPPIPGGLFPVAASLADADSIFEKGVPVFVEAIRHTERFRVVDPALVQAASTYRRFPVLHGREASLAQLGPGWRAVQPGDGTLIADLLSEVKADAALLTSWRFDLQNQAVVGDLTESTATPRVTLRVWVVDRNGHLIADLDEEVDGDDVVPLHSTGYDKERVPPTYLTPIEACAVRLVAQLSNARAAARGGER